jgi:hypothetical protein
MYYRYIGNSSSSACFMPPAELVVEPALAFYPFPKSLFVR